MDIQSLKDYIYEHNSIPEILQNLGCHHILHKSGYYTCGNPDGDNPNAISVYDCKQLTTVNYTREISSNGISADIFSLVEFFEKCNFFYAVNKVCQWIGINYYSDLDSEVPESIKITKMILAMNSNLNTDDDKPVKPISEKILKYYNRWVNDFFLNDNIPYDIQNLFEVGYDDTTNRITIPIRDELGTLVGIKGRLYKKNIDDNDLKYIYLEPCSRSKILYGLNLSLPYIIKSKTVYITESEKGVMQMFSYGYCNTIATGGKKISNSQIEKITRLCSDVVFLFDKDVKQEEIKSIADKFIDSINVFAVIDKGNILNEKESPTDNPYKFNELLKTCCERIK